MHIPTSTYRLQFRDGMTFDTAIDFIPCLKSLGISHLYASPIFTATSGSTHGYDVTDCNEIDPAIGGREGFERLSAALKAERLGLILDIVPNHMAASTENAWWADVLKFGADSKYADHFDIDWNQRLTLPILGKSFNDALADGEFELQRDPQTGDWSLAYFDTRLPLNLDSTAPLSGDLKDRSQISSVHDQQSWQLTFWQDAAKTLSYRRFFEVTGLVGLRVEDEQVFADSHALVLDLVRAGHVQGLRLDHIDGLADPSAYLDRLRATVGPEIYIVAEKIVGHGETLPADWPIEGTTGYEFISALSNLFIDPDGMREFRHAYANLSPDAADFTTGLRQAKLLMVERNFEGETNRLVAIAHSLLADQDEQRLASAIKELLVAFPFYRTYGRAGKLSDSDRLLIEQAVGDAAQQTGDRDALDAVAMLLDGGPRREEFQRRFQQLSGPIMAKAMEDTLFYRHNLLLGANEVGGEPGRPAGGVDAFHELMQQRAKQQPNGLSATSTHDTKRGEDARARLYVLSEEPDVWRLGVERWRDMNRGHLTELPAGLTPDANVEWMLYQALAGIWPEEFRDGAAGALTDRFVAYAEKAVREAKLVTDWNAPHEQYEKAVKSYAAALTASASLTFHEDFAETLRPVMAAGYLNSLSQTLIKLTAPGVPDIYQGSEACDFSLVDPDNRRQIDTAELARLLATRDPISELTVPALKQRIIQIGLNLRKRLPALFAEGDYVPVSVTGSRRRHVIAYARRLRDTFTITVTPRMMMGQLEPGKLFAGPEFWDDTAIILPAGLQGSIRDLLTERSIDTAASIPVAKLLGRRPVALLQVE
ncbi:malto-oligosyltrehalose synthase [Rhizobium sp. S163]|uniref:malto-oligosyltrehalose synthase n=1 Tax=Rhizobium sp. S163 TaxID=3055039 RepID=UPI0025A9DFF8|nr:malto-oligosyltrehalose synthase [Rhizobium sp. S163]MDM9646054.1 malto-oligosyltrehalose synthase [Rhizobium sp. S163]